MSCARGYFAVAVTILACTGCGGGGYSPEGGVIVTGKVVKSGNPLDVPNREVALGIVELVLLPLGVGEDGGALPVESAHVAADGSFRLEGPVKGIKPGRYRVAVYQRDRGPGSDLLAGAFSEQASPIEVDIPVDKRGGKHDLGVIELDDHAKKSP